MKISQMWNGPFLAFVATALIVFFAMIFRVSCEELNCEEEICTSEYESPAELATEQPVFVNTESEIIAEPELMLCKWGDFCISEYEYELICTTVYCEAGNQDFQTQAMVCLTILNRYIDESGNFANTINGVIYQKEAYAVTEWTDFENRGWTKQVEQAVKYALEVNEHPADMFYFRTLHYHTFGQSYMKSGDLWFSTEGGMQIETTKEVN